MNKWGQLIVAMQTDFSYVITAPLWLLINFIICFVLCKIFSTSMSMGQLAKPAILLVIAGKTEVKQKNVNDDLGFKG